jgi:hypothetical protein
MAAMNRKLCHAPRVAGTRHARIAPEARNGSSLVAALLLTAAPASAPGPGIRGGVSVNPDQLFVGAQYETDAQVERLHFKPNVEIGFGDDLTALTANFEFVWKFPPLDEAGFNILVGAESSGGLAFEVKIGTFDSPDIQFGVGYTFR